MSCDVARSLSLRALQLIRSSLCRLSTFLLVIAILRMNLHRAKQLNWSFHWPVFFLWNNASLVFILLSTRVAASFVLTVYRLLLDLELRHVAEKLPHVLLICNEVNTCRGNRPRCIVDANIATSVQEYCRVVHEYCWVIHDLLLHVQANVVKSISTPSRLYNAQSVVLYPSNMPICDSSAWCCHIQCRGCCIVQRTRSIPPSFVNSRAWYTCSRQRVHCRFGICRVVAGYLHLSQLIGMIIVVVWLSPGGWLLYCYSVNWDVIYCVAVLFSLMPVVDDCCVCSVQRYFLSSPSKSKIWHHSVIASVIGTDLTTVITRYPPYNHTNNKNGKEAC